MLIIFQDSASKIKWSLPEVIRQKNQGGVLALYLGNCFFIWRRKFKKNETFIKKCIIVIFHFNLMSDITSRIFHIIDKVNELDNLSQA